MVMDNLYFIFTLLAILGFWLYDAYKLLTFYGRVEEAKSWEKRTAILYGIKPASVKNKIRKGFLARAYSILLSPQKHNIFAYFYEKDIKIGVFRLSLYHAHNRHISFSGKKIFRDNPEKIDVYVNPKMPHEAIIIPPSEHKIVGKVVWFGIKTFFLTFFLLYLFF